MIPHKRRILILFGGRSGEHEVSIVSATHVFAALDPHRYDVALVGITKAGEWVRFPAELPLTELDRANRTFERALIGPDTRSVAVRSAVDSIDVVVPILHGPAGEDGTIQGFLELTGLPYVGCGVLASAVAMDKVTAKRLFRDGGLPVTDWRVASQRAIATRLDATSDELEHAFSYPMFVKPVNLGSSVGVSKATDRPSLQGALRQAAEFDRRVLVEPAVPHAREIEVAVLGNDEPRVSVPGEIVPDREFYDYDSKYGSDSVSQSLIPAPLDPLLTERIQTYARQAFGLIDGAGLARVDFLVDATTSTLFLNEVNTMPGFTPISMYPKLWAASGVSYGELLDQLIQLAIERAGVKQSLRTSRV